MIIALEGLDYSGKGEVGKHLAATLGAFIYATPPGSFREVRAIADKYMTSLERYEFYLKSVQEASRELSEMPTDRLVIVDRYWMTTVAYRRAEGIDASLADFGPILLPEFTIFLDVSPEVQQQRLAFRAMSEGDKRDFQHMPAVRREYHTLLSSVFPRYFVVDTSNLTLGEVATTVTNKILDLTLS